MGIFLDARKKQVVSLFEKLWKMVEQFCHKSFLEFMLFQLLKGQSEIYSKLLACRYCSVVFLSFLKHEPLPLIGIKILFTNSILR